MSIIYDALKKVETSAAAANNNANLKVTPKNIKRKVRPYLLYALVICFGIFIGSILFRTWEQSSPKDTAADINPPSAAPQPQQPQQPKTVSVQMQSKAQFLLTGVFFSENEGYALINNRILKEGDKINGATVTRIGLDEVELEFEGSNIKLSNVK